MYNSLVKANPFLLNWNVVPLTFPLYDIFITFLIQDGNRSKLAGEIP